MNEKSNWFLKVPSRTTTVAMIVVSIAVGLIGAWLSYCCGKSDLASAISLFISFGSFAALIFTVYYAYRLVLVSWVPVGSFGMIQDPGSPGRQKDLYRIFTFPKNHTQLQNIEMWVKLNPKVNNQPVIMDGYYGGGHGWYIQPDTTMQGHFHIEDDILKKVGQSISSMKQAVTANPDIRKSQLRFTVKIRFRGVESNIERNYPGHDSYFDFTRDVLVLDV